MVKCQRVIIEAGGGTFTLDLHPRLSVIAGLGPPERESLISEIIGALGGSRTGVHLELRDATGRHLAVFRPKGERHRVIDVTTAEDVSHEFVGPGGQIDLLLTVGPRREHCSRPSHPRAEGLRRGRPDRRAHHPACRGRPTRSCGLPLTA